MARRSLLTFQESNGHVRAEMLGPSEDFADLVDPIDGSVLHTEPFTMHGADWTIESVSVSDDLMRVKCAPAATRAQTHAPERSRRLGG